MIIIALLTMVLGYAGGRLHGRSLMHGFLYEGFQLLRAMAILTGRDQADVDERVFSAKEIRDAFGYDRAVS